MEKILKKAKKIIRWILATRFRRILASLLVIILIIGPLSFLLFNKKTEAAWWNESWYYRKAVSISNSTAFSGTNIPYKVIIDTATPIAAGKMQADADDIRVLDKNGKVVRHQIEQSTLNTTTTGLWFEGSIAANSAAIYYLYYGNANVSALTFSSDVLSAGDGTTVEMNDGFGYTTDTAYAKISNIRKNSVSLGINGNNHYTSSGYPGNWWDDRAFTRTLLASGPLFVEVKLEDTNYGSYSSFGTNIKMFANGFAETRVFLNYNTSGSEYLYYYLNFNNGTRNSLWVNGSETLVDQSADSGNLYEANLGDNWFGQRWTGTGNYGGTIITKNGSDWETGYTSAQSSYYQTNYSYTEAFTNGSSRQIRYGVFAGIGTSNEMSQKASLLGGYSTSAQSEEKSPAPVAYWKFDEGYGTAAKDSTSNGFNGTISGTNSPVWQPADKCVSGSCLYFDGSNTSNNGTVVVSESSNSKINILGDVTESVWIKPTSNYYDAYEAILRNGQGADLVYSIFYDTANQSPYFHWYDGAFKGVSAANNSAPFNKWSNIVIVRSGTTVSFYVNGIFSASSTVTAPTVAAAELAIGRTNNAGVPQDYTGYMDELKIYPYARTAAQIKQDYNAGSAGMGTAKGTAVSIGEKSDKWLTDGLVGHWKMDEASWNGTSGEVKDASGNGKNGTAVNGTTTAAGKFGNGGSFDGTNDYVDLGSPLSTTSRTYSIWVKPTSGSSSSRDGVLGENGGSRIDYGNGVGTSTFHALVLLTSGSPSYVELAPTTSGLNAWNHIVLTIDSTSGIAKLYQNGVLYDTKTWDTSIRNVSSAQAQFIGRVNSASTFPGYMDDARIYNRALSPKEVSDLYEWAPGPKLYYNFEEGSGANVQDSSGNGTAGSWNGTGSFHYRPGKYGKAANLNGTDDFISIPNYAMPSTGTIEYWAISNISTWNDHGLPISKRDDFIIHSVLDATAINLYTNSTTYIGQVTPNVPINQWNHYAWTLNGSQSLFYINGILVSTINTSNLWGTSTNTLYIGKDSTLARYFNGKVDDFKIYNYARTPKQILEDMNAGGPANRNPVGYWKMDEGYGATANNQISGQPSFTLANSPNNPSWDNNGKFNKALHFDGALSVTTEDSASATYTAQTWDEGTLSLWIKPDSLPAAEYYPISDYNGVVGENGGWIVAIGSDGSCSIRGNSAYDDGCPASTFQAGQWTHLVWVVNKTQGFAKVYANGKLIYTDSSNTFGFRINTTLRVGMGSWCDTSNDCIYPGFIDEVKIFNYALSAEEVAEDMNQGKAMVLGSTGTNSSGSADNSSSREYCVPGDASTCSAPVGEWKFDEGVNATANDTSGSGHTGTLTNGPAWIAGKVGKALNFDGGDDFVSLTRFTLTAGLTLGAWVKTTSTDSATDYAGNAAQNVIGDNTNGVDIGFGVHGGKVRYNQYTSSWENVTGNTSVNDGNWHYIAVTHNLSGAIKLYVDGKIDATGSITYNSAEAINRLGGGYLNGTGTGDLFTGSIDQIRVYDYARTPAQIAWDYNRGGPVGWWKMDECQGGTLHDASGNGNNGTWSGTGGGSQTSVGTCTTSGTAWGNGATGKLNSSLNFDGTDDHITVNDTTSLRQGNSWTISAWIKLKDSDPGNDYDRIIIGKTGWHGGILRYGGQIHFSIMNTVGTRVDIAYTPTSEVWYYYSAVYTSSTGNMNFYVNGVSAGTATFNTGTTMNYEGNSTLYIGGSGDTDYHTFAGIDDARVYNYALTPSQVKDVYNNGTVNFGN